MSFAYQFQLKNFVLNFLEQNWRPPPSGAVEVGGLPLKTTPGNAVATRSDPSVRQKGGKVDVADPWPSTWSPSVEFHYLVAASRKQSARRHALNLNFAPEFSVSSTRRWTSGCGRRNFQPRDVIAVHCSNKRAAQSLIWSAKTTFHF